MQIRTIALILALPVFFSCKNDPKPGVPPSDFKQNAVKVTPPTEGGSLYKVTEGLVHWSATYTVGKKGHEGTIQVESGELQVSQGQLVFGKVILDMNSITATDVKDPNDRRELDSHLKDSDFFETNKFPKAQFEFMEVLPNNTPNFNWVLSGTLTLKGIRAPVNIPVKVTLDGDTLVAESVGFPINRTQWGVNFNSGIIGTAMDKMVDDIVPIYLKVTAKKGQ